jgi:hypothetical protein
MGALTVTNNWEQILGGIRSVFCVKVYTDDVGGSLGQFLVVPVNLTGIERIEVNFLEP